MFPHYLLVSLIFFWTALQGAKSSPSPFYSLYIPTCESSNSSTVLAEQCASVCQPVRDVQDCHLNTACTCTTAPAEALQACLQCHLQAEGGSHGYEATQLIPSRLSSYAVACGDSVFARAQDVPAEVTTSEEDSASPSVSARETYDRRCVYGLPDIIVLPPARLEMNRAFMWPIAFFVVVVLCILENRRRTSK
ncbi:hypothetical protein B0H21DRAFT_709920 [Amylocystis lapponica]|nr:hypothetical protein B0H21DRAFT_709920 [Amylocystis lapponica]